MYFFHSIDEIKQYVSGSIDNDMDFLESIESDIRNAAMLHIAPWLGMDLLERLAAMYPDAAEDSPEAMLTAKVQAALAPLALYHASKTKTVRFGVQGITKSDNAAYRYQENEYRTEMLISGYEYLELMLRYLEMEYWKAQASVYEDAHDGAHGLNDPFFDWDGRERHLSLMLRYASDFRQVSAHQVTRHTFNTLLPLIEEVEYNVIEKRLPSQFYELMRSHQFDKTPLFIRVLNLMKKIIAAFTVKEALRRNLAIIDGGQLLYREVKQEQANETTSIASLEKSEKAHSWQEVAAHRLWIQLKELLEKNRKKVPMLYHTSVGGSNADTDSWGYVPPIVEKVEKVVDWVEKKVVGFW
jgi:hypothetical protein